MAAGAVPYDPPASRRELDQLGRRLDDIDRNGTRGAELLSSQTRQNTEAIGRLQAEISARFTEHTRQHEAEAADRRRTRRWRVTTGIAAAVALITALSLLVTIVALLTRYHTGA